MIKKFLVAFGAAAEPTAEVAEAVGNEMRLGGAIVDVVPVEEIKDISGYDGVVVGSAVRTNKLLSKTRKFLRKNRRQLKKLPLAYFLVCMTMMEDTPENIEKATEFAKPLLSLKQPVTLGLFGGCVDPDKMSGTFTKMTESPPKEDKRDWGKIRSRAREALVKLSEA